MSNLTTQLPEDIRNEFQVDTDGKVYAKSIRAIARLAGVDHKSVLALLERVKNGGEVITSETLQTLTRVDFQVGNSEIIRIPDIAVASIIHYYAYESKAANDIAKRVALAFSSIGFRTYMQQQLGWQQNNISMSDVAALMSSMTTLVEKVNSLEVAVNEGNVEREELKEFKKEVSAFDRFIELLEITKNELEKWDYPEGVTTYQFLLAWNNHPDNKYNKLDPSAWATVSKRASQYYRMLEGKSPDKRFNINIFPGRTVSYLIAVVKLIKEGV